MPTFTEQHVLLAWGGGLPGGETWTNTLRMAPPGILGTPSQEDVVDWLEGGIKDALATFWGTVDTFISSPATLAWAKANRVGTNGKYLDDTTNLYEWETPINGALGSVAPNQTSIVVTTRTAAARGRAHAGRFYLPAVGMTLNSTTGLISTEHAQIIADAGALLINQLNNATDILTIDQLKCAVMSGLGSGTTREITGVSVGRVLDTQRRRRNQTDEAPVYAPLP